MSLKKKRMANLERQIKKDFLVFILVIFCVVLTLILLIAMYAPEQIGRRKK